MQTSDITIIPEYTQIKDMILGNTPLVFVTGGAGTGKSTLISWLEQTFEGSVLLAAPTGIAALNIGGRTLHSLCLLPPSWVLPKDIKRMHRNKEIREASVLIIDEISMVNPNILDSVDLFFKKNRSSRKPFGGLSVVVVGDLHQLPPVINKRMYNLFDNAYNGINFYDANCMKIPYKVVFLKQTFRQKDKNFVKLLSNIRKGNKLPSTLEALNDMCNITDDSEKGAVRLCPRNAEVFDYNMDCLDAIQNKQAEYLGESTGIFKDEVLPAPFELLLKRGAQVMFVKNDVDKRWVNGTVGVVVSCKKTYIKVQITECGTVVEVPQAVWENYKFAWDNSAKEIQRVVIGTYTQFPLTLAWAMTIHKSQGRTIERVHLDLGSGAFATGQTYVALSRCPTVQGISLSRTVRKSDVRVDQKVLAYYKKVGSWRMKA